MTDGEGASSAESLAQVDAVTSGDLRRTLFVLALPVLGEQLLNACVGMWDVYLAGQISTTATNAVGLAAYVSWFATLLFSLVAVGTTALVARHVGSRDFEGADRVCNQSIPLAVCTGLVVALALALSAPGFAAWQNMTGEAGVITIDFLRYDSLGYVAVSVMLTTGAALRGASDMRTPMLIYAVMNVLNMAISWALVYGTGPFPEMGVNGIVTGTVIARWCGGALALLVLLRGRMGLKLGHGSLRVEGETLRRLLLIGLPAAVDGLIMWFGQFMFLRIISELDAGPAGKAMYAAHIIAVRIESLSYLPALAWATATATIVGQALGARDVQRARRAGHEGVLQSGMLILAAAVFFYVFSDPIFHVMAARDPLVHAVGAAPFRTLAFFQPCLAISIVYIGALRGAGNTRLPLLITAVGMLAIRLPLGYYFGIVRHGALPGAWVGMFSDMTWRAVAATCIYLPGRWTRTRV